MHAQPTGCTSKVLHILLTKCVTCCAHNSQASLVMWYHTFDIKLLHQDPILCGVMQINFLQIKQNDEWDWTWDWLLANAWLAILFIETDVAVVSAITASDGAAAAAAVVMLN